MDNYFESPFRGVTLDKQVTHPNIVVGRFSYYSGYYHGHSFEDCARYLLPDEGVDRLIVGGYASGGLAAWAAPVDGVLSAQLANLKTRAEKRGRPT